MIIEESPIRKNNKIKQMDTIKILHEQLKTPKNLQFKNDLKPPKAKPSNKESLNFELDSNES